MKNVKELKDKLHDSEFIKLFSNVKTSEDIIKIAAEHGYDITKADIENYELSDEMLDQVAGGKFDTFVICPDSDDPTKFVKINITPNKK